MEFESKDRYTGYDDDEFDPSFTPENRILPQYDEVFPRLFGMNCRNPKKRFFSVFPRIPTPKPRVPLRIPLDQWILHHMHRSPRLHRHHLHRHHQRSSRCLRCCKVWIRRSKSHRTIIRLRKWLNSKRSESEFDAFDLLNPKNPIKQNPNNRINRIKRTH